MEGNTINQVHSTKFLKIIDDGLSWKSHVKQESTKVAKQNWNNNNNKSKTLYQWKNNDGHLPCICLSIHNLLQHSLRKHLQCPSWSIINIAEKSQNIVKQSLQWSHKWIVQNINKKISLQRSLSHFIGFKKQNDRISRTAIMI